MGKNKQNLGRWGEDQAAQYLKSKSYKLLERNLRNEYGELDLIASKRGKLIFVEVKARSSTQFGFPEEAITPKKQQHLLDAAEAYLLEHPELDGDWRIDVIAVLRLRGQPPEIVHFENALN